LNHRIYKLENNDNHNDNADDGIEEETEDILSQIMGFTKSSQNNNNIQEPKKNVIMMQSNPLTSLFDSLLPKKKVENENNIIDSDSEEEYENINNKNIFVNKDELEFIDEDFEEINCKIETIDDIINLGNRFKILDDVLNDSNNKKKNDNSKNKNIFNNKGIIFKFIPTTQNIPNISTNILKKNDKDENTKSENTKDTENNNGSNTKSADKIVEYDKDRKMYKFENKYYSIDPLKLKKLAKPLTRLKNMIGLDSIKDSILDFITHYLQKYEHNKMLHTVLQGPPGVGKTKLGKIIAEIYSAMDVIPSSRCKLVTRNDLIGQYVGETARKTQEQIDSAEGGVLFIDEAYALGDDGKNVYGKECIDCINQNLSEKKKKLIIIIAGYEDALQKYFFSQNEGLNRRFPFRYSITGYNESEMKDIFLSFIRRKKLRLHCDVTEDKLVKLFKKEKEKLVNYGGDIENIITQCELLNDRLHFGAHPKYRNIIDLDIIKKSIEKYQNNVNKDSNNTSWKKMYI